MSANLARTQILPTTGIQSRNWAIISGDSTKAKAEFLFGSDFEELENGATRISFNRNETIFEDRQSAKYCYRLVSGAIRLCKFLADGRRQIVGFHLPGDFLGLGDINTYDFCAEAITDVVVLRYTRTYVDMMSSRDALLRHKFDMILREQLCAAYIHLVALGRHTVKERVSFFLIRIAERLGLEPGVRGSIDLPMSRLDIADYLGLTIETVCRAISDLKRAGTIEVPNTHRIVLRNTRHLHELAEGCPSHA